MHKFDIEFTPIYESSFSNSSIGYTSWAIFIYINVAFTVTLLDMDTVQTFIIGIFKQYGVAAGFCIIFLYLFFYKALPTCFTIVDNFIAVVKGLGDKLEKAAEKTSDDLARIMQEFKEDRRLSREAHKLEIDNIMSTNERMITQFINLTSKPSVKE